MTNPDIHYDTIIIGGGQAGLATGYYLKQQGRDFVILDAHERIGDAWRKRWDSLRLFTPARYDGLPGMPFPAPPNAFPTKDEMADFLESYAGHFDLPVRTGVWVERLSKQGDLFLATNSEQRYTANNVVIAMSSWQKPNVPSFADQLDPDIVQLHSSAYKNPAQLQNGAVLVVGAGNSGAEIALEAAKDHPTWISGEHPGHIPFRIETLIAKYVLVRLVVGVLFHHILNLGTPIGRKARHKVNSRGIMLVRTKPQDLNIAEVERLPRTVGVRDGLPLLDDGRVLEVANVIWATGYDSGLSWVDIPAVNEMRDPAPERGVAASVPGLYCVGRFFQYAASSGTIRGVARDAKYIAGQIAARTPDSVEIDSQSLNKRKPHVV